MYVYIYIWRTSHKFIYIREYLYVHMYIYVYLYIPVREHIKSMRTLMSDSWLFLCSSIRARRTSHRHINIQEYIYIYISIYTMIGICI